MKRYIKLISVFCALAVILGVFTGCVINTNPAITVDGTDFSKDEYGYYMATQASMMIQEAGVNAEDATAVDDFLNSEKDGKKNIDAIREKTNEHVSKFLVQYNKAKELGVTLSDEEKAQIQTELDTIKQNIGGEAEYKKRLEIFCTTPEAFASIYEKEAIVSKLSSKLVENGTITVSDEDAEKYVKDEYIKAQHILFMIQDPQTGTYYDAATVELKRQQAQETLDRINNGEDFYTLMHELSEDTGLETYPDGYEFSKGQMVPQFEEAAYALEENKVSGIVETSYGFHIIKRMPFEITPEKVEEYKPTAKEKLQSEKYEALAEEWAKTAKVKTNDNVIKKIKLNYSEE